MMPRLHPLRRRALLVEALTCALVVRASLRLASIPFAVRAARLAGALFPSHGDATDCVRAATRAARHLAHPTCLYRALTAYAMLAHRDGHARFHLGAARAGDVDVAMHAWVTVDGRALDADADRYAALWTAPSRPASL